MRAEPKQSQLSLMCSRTLGPLAMLMVHANLLCSVLHAWVLAQRLPGCRLAPQQHDPTTALLVR